MMTLEDCERIVQRTHPRAFPFFAQGGWSICNGTTAQRGHIRIEGVGFHETIEAAWLKAVGLVQQGKDERA